MILTSLFYRNSKENLWTPSKPSVNICSLLLSTWNGKKSHNHNCSSRVRYILAFLTKDDVGYRRKEVSSMSVESPASPNYTNRVTSSKYGCYCYYYICLDFYIFPALLLLSVCKHCLTKNCTLKPDSSTQCNIQPDISVSTNLI